MQQDCFCHARKDVLWRDKSIPRGPIVLCKREIIGLVPRFVPLSQPEESYKLTRFTR